MISVDEAFQRVQESVRPLPTETVPLSALPGRHLAQTICADVDSPPHDKSVMDGFAIRASDFDDSQTVFDLGETIIAGAKPSSPLGQGQAAQIMTGAPIPDGADVVVMVEQSEVLPQGDGTEKQIRLNIDSVAPEQNVLRRGANFHQGDLLFSAGHRVRPCDVGLLAEVGVAEALVGGLPSIAVLPTGNELVSCDQTPQQAQIRNSNGPMLTAMIDQLGLVASELPIGRDDEDQLQALIQQGLQSDVLILTGGVSAGTKDLVPGILARLGVRQVFHKVLVKPGKPIWFGILDREPDQCVVFGLPGNPVSSLVGFRLFVRSAINILCGGQAEALGSVEALLDGEHQTRGNRPTYWPGRRVAGEDGVRRVRAVDWKGSSDLGALGKADGLIRFTVDNHHHPIGERVEFYPFA